VRLVRDTERKRDRNCVRRIPERDRDQQELQRDLRLCGMNTHELGGVIGDYLKRFVFSVQQRPSTHKAETVGL